MFSWLGLGFPPLHRWPILVVFGMLGFRLLVQVLMAATEMFPSKIPSWANEQCAALTVEKPSPTTFAIVLAVADGVCY
jgi:hypothetical protein